MTQLTYFKALYFALAIGIALSSQHLAKAGDAPGTNEDLPVRYEAEDAQLADGAAAKNDSHASGERFVQIAKRGSMVWRVLAPEDGRYEIIFRFRTGPADRAEILSVNGVDRGLGFSMSANEWVEMKTVRPLKKGENRVELKADWGLIDVDYLRFDAQPRGKMYPLTEYPTISPRRNTHYIGRGDLTFKLDDGGNAIQRIEVDSEAIAFTTKSFEHVDDSKLVTVAQAELDRLREGSHALRLVFANGIVLSMQLDVRSSPASTPWQIFTLNIDHGTAVVMKLPSGKIAMIDTAYAQYAEKIVVPFLKQCGITKIDYLFITHFHDDHAGGLPLIEKTFEIGSKYDYNNLKVQQILDVDGVKTTVLNSKEGGEDENSRSLTLRMEYNGFVYLHGGDNYGGNQEKQLQLFPREFLRANLFHANHHFHGSVDASFCRVVDPQLVIVSAQQAVYARAAFMTIYKDKVERYLKASNARLNETLLTCEAGNIAVRINSGDDWSYETTEDFKNLLMK